MNIGCLLNQWRIKEEMAKIIRRARRFQRDAVSTEISRIDPAGDNTDKLLSDRIRELPVGKARVHRKEAYEIEDQLHCERRFDCSFGNSMSTEPEASVTFWRGAGLAVTNNAKPQQVKLFKREHE
jgi:hypothetical protein